MIYHFTYRWQGKTLVKICMDLREAETFFAILMSVKCEYLCIKTIPRRSTNYD